MTEVYPATDALTTILASEHVLGQGLADPPAQVLRCCAARQLSADARARLRELVGRSRAHEWKTLLSLAHVQGMAPLVFEHVAHADLLDCLPSDVRAQLKEEYQQTLIHNRRWKTVLTAVLRGFAAQRIPVISLKGLRLAEALYANIALRPMFDIDLLIQRKDVDRAIAVLRQLGFAAVDGMARPTGFYALTSAGVEYARADGATIELHWELAGPAIYRSSLPVSDAWQRALPRDIVGQQAHTLDYADELRYLCVHAVAQHRRARLIWLTDIAEMVRSLPEAWDWSAFVAGTITARVAAPVALALVLCRERAGLVVPGDVLERLCAASAAPAERAAWEDARAALLSERWIVTMAAQIHGPVSWAIFLRGVLLPRAPTLSQLYVSSPQRDLLHLRAYAHHWRRTAPWVLRAIVLRWTRAGATDRASDRTLAQREGHGGAPQGSAVDSAT